MNSDFLKEQIRILQKQHDKLIEQENEDFMNQLLDPIVTETTDSLNQVMERLNQSTDRLNQSTNRLNESYVNYYKQKQIREKDMWSLNFSKDKTYETSYVSRTTIVTDRDVNDYVPVEIAAYDEFIKWEIGGRQKAQFKKITKRLNLNDFIISVRLIKSKIGETQYEKQNSLKEMRRETNYRVKSSKLTKKNFSELFPFILKERLYRDYSRQSYYMIEVFTLFIEFHNVRVNNYAVLKINKFRYNYQKGDIIKCDTGCLKNYLISKGIQIPKKYIGLTLEQAMDRCDKAKIRINFIMEDGFVKTSSKKINYKSELNVYVVDDHIEIYRKSDVKIKIIDNDITDVEEKPRIFKWLNAGIVPIIENANLVNGRPNILSYKVNDVVYKKINKINKLVKKYKEVHKSYYNLEAYAMISKMNAFGIHSTINKPTNQVKYQADFIKCYTNIIKDIEIPIYSIFDEIIDCNELGENGLYRMATINDKTNFLRMEMGKFYPKSLVEYAKCKVDKCYIPKKWFKFSNRFIAEATGCTLKDNLFNSEHKNFDLNKWIGTTNIQNKSFVKARLQTHHTGIDDAHFTYFGKDDNKTDWWLIGDETKELDNSNYRMIYNFINFEQARRLAILADSCEYVIEVRADCVIYEGNCSYTENNVKIEKFTGELKEFKTFELNHVHTFDKFPCYNDSYFIWGPAGTGKTTHLNELSFELQKKNEKYVKVAPTNSAAAEIQGVTIDSLFFKNGFLQYNRLNDYDIMIIDEIGMVSEEIYNILLKLKLNRPEFRFIFVGDPINQLLARGIDSIVDKTFFKELINTSYKLEKCYRFTGEWDQYKIIEKDTMIHIAYTNEKCKEINDIYFKKYGLTRLIAKDTFLELNIYKSNIYNYEDVKKFYTPKLFDLGYCITVHKSQGKSLDEYTIHEFDKIKNDKRLHYVAVTRRKGDNGICIKN